MAELLHMPKGVTYKNMIFPPFTTPELLAELTTNFQPRDSDIFVCTYPRSGTTWIQHILAIMKSQAKIDISIYNLSPFLEIPSFETSEELEEHFPGKKFPLKSEIDNIPAPRIFKSHLPFEFIPKNPKSKYIYCYRNPKDNLISMYHHICGKARYDYDGTFEHFFEIYIKGQVAYGSWFDHVIGWWEHRDDPNVLILSYEELHKNFNEKVHQLAAFTGFEITGELFELIEKETNFQAMKANELVALSETIKSRRNENDVHVRKGVVGQWRNVLTPEQNQIIDDLITSRLKGNSLYNEITFDL